MKKNKAFSLIELSIVILVIGILISGVTQGSRLINAYRLSTAATITNSSPVSSIPNLTLWLEPVLDGNFVNSNDNSDISNNDYVKTWKDSNTQQSVKNDGTQSTSTDYPQYKRSAIVGLPALLYDGTDCLFITNNVFGYNYSVFAVAKTNNPTGAANYGVVSRDVPNLANDSVPIVISGGYVKTIVGTPSSDTTVPSGSTSKMVDDGTPHILYASRSRDTATVNIYADGGNNVSQGSMPTSNLTDSGATSIGCINSSVPGNRFVGYIAEVIAFDRVLKNEERQSVEKYLSKKWSIPLAAS